MKSSYNRLGKFVLVLLIYFSVVSFPLVSEEGTSSGEKQLEAFVGKEKVETLTEDSPIDIVNDSSSGDGKVSPLLEEFTLKEGSETVSYTSHVFRLILSLIFVVFLAYVVVRLMKKSKLFVVNDDAYLRLVAQLNIEQGKSIKVFTLGDRAYVVGVSGNNITKIAEIEDKVLIDTMNLKASETNKVNATSSFAKVFSSFFPATEQAKNSQQEMLDDEFLKKQRTRIKNMNLKNE